MNTNPDQLEQSSLADNCAGSDLQVKHEAKRPRLGDFPVVHLSQGQTASHDALESCCHVELVPQMSANHSDRATIESRLQEAIVGGEVPLVHDIDGVPVHGRGRCKSWNVLMSKGWDVPAAIAVQPPDPACSGAQVAGEHVLSHPGCHFAAALQAHVGEQVVSSGPVPHSVTGAGHGRIAVKTEHTLAIHADLPQFQCELSPASITNGAQIAEEQGQRSGRNLAEAQVKSKSEVLLMPFEPRPVPANDFPDAQGPWPLPRPGDEGSPPRLMGSRTTSSEVTIAMAQKRNPSLREEQLAALPQPLDLDRPYVVDTAAQARVAQVQEMYAEYMAEAKADQKAKPDMQFFRQMRAELTPEHVVGHIPGTHLGQKFHGKGALAILGIHCNITAGIYSSGDTAYAVVSAGGYKDDDDQGGSFIYTGAGGQVKGVQVKDQEWVRGNAALRSAFFKRQPVRVCRSYPSKDAHHKTPVIVYCGLYLITSAELKPGKDGFKVCQFQFEPIPGHSVYGAPVPIRPRYIRKAPVQLASALVPRQRSKDRDPVGYDRGTLVCADIGVGEAVAIPVYNSVDDQTLDGTFAYIRESRLRTDSQAGALIARANEVFVKYSLCAFEVDPDRKLHPYYLPDGRLTETSDLGVYECPETCTAPLCRQNRVVTSGIKAKLEVFRTPNSGWGVRAGSFLDVGTFVCTYEGQICTDQEAEKLRGVDEYLYALDHFHKLLSSANDPDSSEFEAFEDLVQLCPPDGDGEREHLVVDAKDMGNIGRFLNHSCSPNLVPVVVLTQGCTPLRYRLAFFIGKSSGVAPGEELTYNYGWTPNTNTVLKGLQCHCGAPNCIGSLL